MRTAVVLRDDLVAAAKKLTKERTLSCLLNTCLADWIARHSLQEIEARLAREYREAGPETRRVHRAFTAVDREGWPSW